MLATADVTAAEVTLPASSSHLQPCMQEVEQLLAALPLANRVSAALIIQTCYRIASQFDKTGMNALALAQELGPLLLWRVSSGQEALHVAAAAAANTPAWAGASLVAGIQAQAQTPPPSMGLPVSTALGGGGGGGVKEGLVGAEKEAWLRVVEFLILNAEELFPAPHWL
ncbi:hypothetical protein HaLaN_13900 [Haematococcus lacustris]|uniref:Rho-GAP domain-containing protein n=1 Tax=Haematococcus lacustris TaxID=44745 RepID=A0A699ZEI3_HAELA|nr:hypothetical protein HaLaN_13900 [Haematococcus lacustris]